MILMHKHAIVFCLSVFPASILVLLTLVLFFCHHNWLTQNTYLVICTHQFQTLLCCSDINISRLRLCLKFANDFQIRSFSYCIYKMQLMTHTLILTHRFSSLITFFHKKHCDLRLTQSTVSRDVKLSFILFTLKSVL